jgi:chitinase
LQTKALISEAPARDHLRKRQMQMMDHFANVAKFNTLEDLEKAMPEFPRECAHMYAIPIYSEMIKKAVEDSKAVDKGYDKVWPYYEEQSRQILSNQLEKFMNEKGRKYFLCKKESQTATARCDDKKAKVDDTNNLLFTFIDNDAETNFWKELDETTGLPKDGIVFTSREDKYPKDFGGHKNGSADPIADTKKFRNGYPVIPYNYPIANPKHIIANASQGMEGLFDTFFVTELNMISGMWLGETADPFQVYSVPAFMVKQVLESMKEAKKIGEQLKKEEIKNIVLNVLNAAFLLLPFAGNAAAAASGLSLLARGAGLVTVAGSAGLGIYDSVENPKMAPLAILGILLGGTGMRGAKSAKTITEKDVKQMADLRKEITPQMMKGMGSSFEKDSNLVQRMGSTCYRRKG